MTDQPYAILTEEGNSGSIQQVIENTSRDFAVLEVPDTDTTQAQLLPRRSPEANDNRLSIMAFEGLSDLGEVSYGIELDAPEATPGQRAIDIPENENVDQLTNRASLARDAVELVRPATPDTAAEFSGRVMILDPADYGGSPGQAESGGVCYP